MRFDKKYLYWGLTAFAVICGVLVFYDTVFQHSVLLLYLNKLVIFWRRCSMDSLWPIC